MTSTEHRITTARQVAELVTATTRTVRQDGASTVAALNMRDERDGIDRDLALVDISLQDLWEALHTRDRADLRDAAQDTADAAAAVAVQAVRVAAIANRFLDALVDGEGPR